MICYRHDRFKPTILVTNLAPKAVADLLGDRLEDRVNESCIVVTLPEASRRRPAALNASKASAFGDVAFNGSMPKLADSEGPDQWLQFLEEVFPGKREDWREYQYAPEFSKIDFGRWLKGELNKLGRLGLICGAPGGSSVLRSSRAD